MLELGCDRVAEAGVIQTEVMWISPKSLDDPRRWVYLDIGKFGGLKQILGEVQKYPICSHRDGPLSPVVLAGSSGDILDAGTPYLLPSTLEIGDRLEILNAGACPASYSSLGFSGVGSLRSYCVDGRIPQTNLAGAVI
jgi:ornithine decarboxylase